MKFFLFYALIELFLVKSVRNNKINSCVFEYNSSQLEHGEIYSPNYPLAYPNNLNCRYEFYAKENERVIIEIEDFELEPPQNNANQEANFMDFILTNTRINNLTNPANRRLETATSLNLATDLNRQCFYDFLDVFSTDGQGRLYWRSRHCGSNIESQIVSNSPTLILIFQTDRMLNFRGFKLKFHFSYLSILPFHSKQSICGSSEIVGNGSLLSSPNYPYKNADSVNCAWTITVKSNQNILIKFVDINLDPPCHRSYVKFWDGYVGDVTKPDKIVCEKLAYYKRGVMMFKSKTNRLVIKYSANQEDSNIDEDYYKYEELDDTTDKMIEDQKKSKKNLKIKKGFQLIWTAVTLNEECDQFMCKGGDFCIDDNKILCQPTNRYCISKSLVCDGVFNCDLGDQSDERQCQLNFFKSNQFLLVLASGVTFFIFLILICLVLHSINNRRTNSKTEFTSKENINDPLNHIDNHLIINDKKLKIKRKTNQLSSFTLQNSNELIKTQNSKLETTLTSSSSSSSLLNKNSIEHYQVEPVRLNQKETHLSTYKPHINKISISGSIKTLSKKDNSFEFLKKSNDTFFDAQNSNILSSCNNSDKKSNTSNTYACSQITTDGSIQSQFRIDEFSSNSKQKNLHIFLDDGSSTLRRNSYTKAIFFENF